MLRRIVSKRFVTCIKLENFRGVSRIFERKIINRIKMKVTPQQTIVVASSSVDYILSYAQTTNAIPIPSWFLETPIPVTTAFSVLATTVISELCLLTLARYFRPYFHASSERDR